MILGGAFTKIRRQLMAVYSLQRRKVLASSVTVVFPKEEIKIEKEIEKERTEPASKGLNLPSYTH